MRAPSSFPSFGLVLVLAACTDASGPLPPSGLSQESIVGGQPDSTSHNVIGILTKEGELCSGSLILPNLVLTARHCVAALASDNVQCGVSNFGAVHPASDFAVSWDDNLRNNIDTSSVFYVSAVQTPPDPGVCGNDVALLELSSNVPANEATPLEPRLDTAPMNNETFAAVGYGLTNPNDTAGTTAGQRMRYDGATVTCVGSACGRTIGAVANEWAGQVPVCSGDSGGPALDSAGRVIGAASRGPQQCNFAVYSGVTAWKSLIIDAATKAVSDGGYAPPGWVSGTTASDGGTPTLDGGTPSDGGTTMSDAGTPSDAGTMMDAGTPSDAGVPMRDGGMSNDGGIPPSGSAGSSGSGFAGGPGMRDGGVPSDGGTRLPDGGTPFDAGTPTSGGVLDAGAPHDGGVAGTQGTAGAAAAGAAGAPAGSEPAPAGCGCRTAPARHATSGYWLLGLVAFAFGRRSHRSRAPRRFRQLPR